MIRVGMILLLPLLLGAQPSWKRAKAPQKAPLSLFHSSQLANLPTAETLKKGDFFYEISHRFSPLSTGYDGLYGIDGPVNMRTALAYGLTQNWMITLGRSNIQDNLDIRIKYKIMAERYAEVPLAMAVEAGYALNSEALSGLNKRDALDPNSFQYYVRFIANTMFLDNKLGIGLTPVWIYNSFIFANDYDQQPKYTFALPVYVQYFFNRMWSVFVESGSVLGGWNGNIHYDASSERASHPSWAGGLALETGGHVFYLFLTNNRRLNPTQYHIGAEHAFNADNIVFAFGITREL
ncbi:MAG: hypothetical protein D6677_05855 [Calditrichaeota bacterium]|nr:MAG: hypothetical protein D6677_05855 [Calditrichota bacterium]